MIELLQASMANGQEYPDSGPGPKTLQYGNEDLGYFGTLAATDFFTQTELATAVNMFGGSLEQENPDWIKCFINKKILFIPSQPIRTALSWNDLYSAGIIYGTEDNGKYPGSPAVYQTRIVGKRGSNFVVRTFGAGDPDPSGLADGAKPDPKNYEWGKFCTAFYDGLHAQFAGSWKIASRNLIIGKAIPQMFSGNVTTSCNPMLFPTDANPLQVYLIGKGWLGSRWQPVLELIRDNNKVYAVSDITDKTLTNDLVPVAFSPVKAEFTAGEVLYPIAPTTVRYDKVGLKPPTLKPVAMEVESNWLSGVRASSIRQVGLIPISVHTIQYEA